MSKFVGAFLALMALLIGAFAAVTFDENGVPQYAPWSGEMVDALAAGMNFLDPDNKGIDRAKLKAIYPMLGWNDLQVGIDALIAAGRLESKNVANAGGVAIEHFYRKEASV